MIKDTSFTADWLSAFKAQAKHKRIDTIILEKMIYAFHLLDQLKTNGLDFVFKGGTSLVLLLESSNRFSIDIDIICNTERNMLESILDKVVKNSKFPAYSLDEHRSYREGVPKAHYGFEFQSVVESKYTGKILLDVLIEDSIYPEHTEKAIRTKWIETENETIIKVPTINSITGDKLTAFAPNTVGIPYFKGNVSFTVEICKQLFDIGQLFEYIDNMKVVAKSFENFAKREIEYRKSPIAPQDVLKDTISTCLILAKKGVSNIPKEKEIFKELQKGIKGFGTGFLTEGNFRLDEAITASAKVAYLSAKIYKNDLSPIEYYDNKDVKSLLIEKPDWNFLNKLKKQADKSAFYYWYKAVELLGAY